MISESLLYEVFDYMGGPPVSPPLILKGNNFLYLKVAAYVNQAGLCICGESLFDGELHHALLSKRDVQGLKNGDFINNSKNVIVIHHECHIVATRQKSFDFLCTIFSEDLILNWYEEVSENFKIKPRALPERKKE